MFRIGSLLNGLIQPFQQPERVNRLLQYLSDGKAGNPSDLTEIADQFHHWLSIVGEMGCTIVEDPQQERRDIFVLPYLQKTEADHVAVILKAREPARILVCHWRKAEPMPSSGTEAALGESIQFLSQRSTLGAHVLSACVLTFLFPARVCLNHIIGWLCAMQQEGIRLFGNARTPSCNAPTAERLQPLADSLTAQDYCVAGK